MWKEKLGNYLIDVSKYFLTGVFVASLVGLFMCLVEVWQPFYCY